MRYDKKEETTPLIITNTLVRNDSLGYFGLQWETTTLLPDSLSYKLNLSYIKVTFKNNSGEIIFERLGELVESWVEGDTLKAYIINDKLCTIPLEPFTIDVSGRIYLTNNTFYNFNKESISDPDTVTLYYDY